MSGALNVKAGIICEAVRREDSGKLMILGAYAGNIVPQAFPATLVLCCVVIAECSATGPLEIELRVSFDGTAKIEGKGSLNIERTGTLLLPVPNILVEAIPGKGILKFEIREQQEKDWQTIVDIPIDPPQ